MPLSHPEDIEDVRPGGRFICGVTNSIFEHKRNCYDAIGVFSSGVIEDIAKSSPGKFHLLPFVFVAGTRAAREKIACCPQLRPGLHDSLN